MDEPESKPDRPKRIPALIVASLLFALAIFLWVKWVHDLWPPNTLHESGSGGEFLIYLWCRGISNILVLAAPLGAVAIGLFSAIAALGSASKFVKKVAIALVVVNGGSTAILLTILLHDIVTGFSFT